MDNYEEKIVWHKIKTRPLTDEEKKNIKYIDWDIPEYMFECEMPDDGEKILIQTGWGISTDISYYIEGFYLDGRGDWDGVIAWAELPKGIKEEQNGDNT